MIAGVSFDQFEVRLHPGDRLLILSDGVTECPDPAGKMLEDTGLEEVLIKLRHTGGTAFLEALMWELSAYAGNAEFPDDVSGILFEYTGQAMPM